MGGSQNIGEASDNPVEINVTAMVDVIFCLCIFFMCSFHFKQVEGQVDAWLPKDDRGNQQGRPHDTVFLEEIRVFMRWDAEHHVTTRKVVKNAVSTDQELIVAVLAMKGDRVRLGIEAPRDVTVDRAEVHARRTQYFDVDLSAPPSEGDSSVSHG